jgi:hypothetical protein
MEKSHFREANSCSINQEITLLYKIERFSIVFTKAPRWDILILKFNFNILFVLVLLLITVPKMLLMC